MSESESQDPREKFGVMTCSKCGERLLLPCEPIYDLNFVAALLSISIGTLKNYLSKGPGKHWEARFRFFPGGSRKRVLFASEVRAIQRHFVRKHYRAATGSPQAVTKHAPEEHTIEIVSPPERETIIEGGTQEARNRTTDDEECGFLRA